MKVLVITWRDPNGNLVSEQLERAKFTVQTEAGWMKLNGDDGPVRYIPSDRVCLVQFAEVEDQPRILHPSNITSMPLKSVPS
jgi:hypothetical protein